MNVSDDVSCILYILAANCDRKHLENSKIRLKNSWKTLGFFLPKEWEPRQSCARIGGRPEKSWSEVVVVITSQMRKMLWTVENDES